MTLTQLMRLKSAFDVSVQSANNCESSGAYNDLKVYFLPELLETHSSTPVEDQLVRAVFLQEASGDDGDISVEVFTEKLGPLLGEGVEKSELLQLFMKIDADCG